MRAVRLVGEVTYLDFGSKHIHIAKAHQGINADIAHCGMGAAYRADHERPGRFKDRPGLFSGEMCKRCAAAALQQGEES